jgi:uncharacterized surface protein with fasciclin (FAS1) repeats
MFRIARSVALTAATTLALGSIGYAAWTSTANEASTAPLAAARETAAAAEKDIVDTAVAAGKFKTLAAALQAAGLVETLKGDGPFTVFAPTDDAFAKLPEGTVASLLKPENKEKLKGILTYHVAAAKAMSSDLSDGQDVKTVNGKSVKVRIDGKTVMVGDAKVVKADVAASNGVIHVIDTVLMP